jgi:hypothetical protein
VAARRSGRSSCARLGVERGIVLLAELLNRSDENVLLFAEVIVHETA